MSATVPLRRGYSDGGGLLSGRVVAGMDWMALAGTANWLVGRGAQTVPAYFLSSTLTAGHAYTFYYWFRPRYQAVQREWSINARTTSITTTATINPNGVGAQTRGFSFDLDVATPRTLIENIAAQTETGAASSLVITPTADMSVYGIAAVDIPRAGLVVNSTELGSDAGLMMPGQPVSRTAIDSMVRMAADATTMGRRVSHFQWAVPTYDNGDAATSLAASETLATPTAIFLAGNTVPILGRKDGRTGTTSVTAFPSAVMWKAGGTQSAKLDIVTAAGTVTLTTTSTYPVWVHGTAITVDCDDFSQSDGRQGGAWGTFEPRLYRGINAGTAYCSTISIWEN